MNRQFEQYKKRRQDLVAAIQKEFPAKNGKILLLGNFEQERHRFRQDSTFYYFTGVEEPGSVLLIDLDGSATLYIPAMAGNRAQWMEGALAADQKTADHYNVQSVQFLGQAQPGYQASPLMPTAAYENLFAALLDTGKALFTCVPADLHDYIEQKFLLERLKSFASQQFSGVVDISAVVARMRRTKSREEIECIYKAVELTMVAQEAAARCMGDGVSEAQVQAGLEYIFTGGDAQPAFPSIVASGKHSTTLHYCRNNHIMKNGDVVVVDIGAELDYYCADLTRTYPVSGTFTQRQREIYSLVLETQEFVASKAKPGMWLSNKERPQESLHHLAVSFLEKNGYGKYFMHGIGHFLGLDVHDVGNSLEPLQEGDVITIEPGIYIAAERLGVRIEDNYWIVRDGVECLSAELPKSIDEVEKLSQFSMQDPFEDDEGRLEEGLEEDNHEDIQ